MPTDWSRPHWKATDRDARLFFFVPGDPPREGLQVSRSRHHLDAFPEALQVSAHDRADAPEWFAGFFNRPGLGSFLEKEFGERAAELQAATAGTVLRGDFPDPPTLDYLRDTVGVVSAVLEQGGLGVLDLLACRWWSPDGWTERFIDRCEFDVADHVQIVSSDDEREHPGLWVHTRGLRKFGRPDLQVKHVEGPWSRDNPLLQAAGDVLQSLAGYLCRGAALEGGHTMTFPGRKGRCTFVASPDDTDSAGCHFGNEVLEVVDLVRGKPVKGLRRLLTEVAAG